MKITLDVQELNQAVLDYLTAQGLNIDTQKALVEITSEGVKIDTNPETANKPSKKPQTPKQPINDEPVKTVTTNSAEQTQGAQDEKENADDGNEASQVEDTTQDIPFKQPTKANTPPKFLYEQKVQDEPVTATATKPNSDTRKLFQ